MKWYMTTQYTAEALCGIGHALTSIGGFLMEEPNDADRGVGEEFMAAGLAVEAWLDSRCMLHFAQMEGMLFHICVSYGGLERILRGYSAETCLVKIHRREETYDVQRY